MQGVYNPNLRLSDSLTFAGKVWVWLSSMLNFVIVCIGSGPKRNGCGIVPEDCNAIASQKIKQESPDIKMSGGWLIDW